MKKLLLIITILISSLSFADSGEFEYRDEIFDITSIDLLELKANQSFNIEESIENALGTNVVTPITTIEYVKVEGELGTMDALLTLRQFNAVTEFKEISKFSKDDDELKNEDGNYVVTLNNSTNEKLTKGWTFNISRNNPSPAVFIPKKVTISVKNLRPF